MSKISKSWKQLTSDQMREWDRLAEHASGQSAFGQKAEITGMNLYIRLNVNRAMAGEVLLSTAPTGNVAVPNVEYSQVIVTPQLMVMAGVRHQPAPYKLVVKMSASQSAGISNGWSKTVIITPGIEDDWGEADVTTLYLKTIGVEPVPGEKVFVEAYWLDTSTGFTGQPVQTSVIVTGESPYQRRVKVTMDDLDPEAEQHVSSLDVDFSTNAPAVYFDSVCLGHSNVASSEAVLDQPLPADCIGIFMAFGRGMGEDGSLHPQSYEIQTTNGYSETKIRFMHRGGKYIKPTEVFGPGVCYPNS